MSVNTGWAGVVAVALLGSLLVASVVVPVLAEVRHRRVDAARRERIGTWTFAVTAVATAALLVAGLPLPFFLALVVVNIVFGMNENVPISRFPMFSRPAIVQWYIRMEDQDGQPLSGPGWFGVPTAMVMKRFNTEMKATDPNGSIYKAGPEARAAAGERVADFLVDLLDTRPYATAPVTALRLVYFQVIEGPEGMDITSEVLTERSR